MARPGAPIIAKIETDDGVTFELLLAEKNYIITYQGKPINMRRVIPSLDRNVLKYMKLSYANRGNCLARVKQLNEQFMTDKFGYIEFPPA